MSDIINEVSDDISEADDGLDCDKKVPKAMRRQSQQPRSNRYFDPAADYTERTGRYLSLSERMQERSRYDQQQHDNEF